MSIYRRYRANLRACEIDDESTINWRYRYAPPKHRMTIIVDKSNARPPCPYDLRCLVRGGSLPKRPLGPSSTGRYSTQTARGQMPHPLQLPRSLPSPADVRALVRSACRASSWRVRSTPPLRIGCGAGYFLRTRHVGAVAEQGDASPRFGFPRYGDNRHTETQRAERAAW